MMNSTVSDDLTRDHFALEAAKCLKNISTNTQNVTVLHKELLEINLSVTTYIEESKRRLEDLRSQLAHEAKSSHRVVEILSNKCTYKLSVTYIFSTLPPDRNMTTTEKIRQVTQKKMSKAPPTPKKQSGLSRFNRIALSDKDSNANLKLSQHQHASAFVTWYRNMLDNERQNFSLYLSDDATLEWFGRTIKTRTKISAFLNHGMQCSRHDFTTVEVIDKIQPRQERPQRKDNSILASPLHSPELIRSKSGKRKHSRLNCSPEWADGCKPDDEDNSAGKRFKTNHTELSVGSMFKHENDLNRTSESNEISSNGDGTKGTGKCVLVTPPNVEIGQGDCHPSTSGTDSDRSHETLNSQLPRLAVQCNGYIEFTRTRNSRSIDSMKWERKCKVQISYSDDPLNIGEYIIWAVRYHDENKCRRNLLDAFEQVAKDKQF